MFFPFRKPTHVLSPLVYFEQQLFLTVILGCEKRTALFLDIKKNHELELCYFHTTACTKQNNTLFSHHKKRTSIFFKWVESEGFTALCTVSLLGLKHGLFLQFIDTVATLELLK